MPLSKKKNRDRMRQSRATQVPLVEGKGSNTKRHKGKIYFILDKENDAVKIGIADNPISRLSDIQVGNPHELSLIKTIDNGTQAKEKRLHKQFAEQRLNGEWFKRSGTLAEYLQVQPNEPSPEVLAELDTAMADPTRIDRGSFAKYVPIYNPRIHKQGDRVLVNGKEVIVPELDGEGSPIPEA